MAAKDAEIAMLRQQLSQLSADLSRHLEVLAARDAEAEEARQAITSLTALLAEKDEVGRGEGINRTETPTTALTPCVKVQHVHPCLHFCSCSDSTKSKCHSLRLCGRKRLLSPKPCRQH